MTRLVFSTNSAFESWLEKAPLCPDLTASRLAFAWELHYADAYDHCLAALEKILATDPEHVGALACKADTLVHLEKHEAALRLADRILRLDGTHAGAWETRGDVFEHRDDWPALLDNCDRWEKAGRLSRHARLELPLQRAVAHCALGHEAEMEKWIQACLLAHRFRDEEFRRRREVFIRRRVFRRAGKPPPAPIGH